VCYRFMAVLWLFNGVVQSQVKEAALTRAAKTKAASPAKEEAPTGAAKAIAAALPLRAQQLDLGGRRGHQLLGGRRRPLAAARLAQMSLMCVARDTKLHSHRGPGLANADQITSSLAITPLCPALSAHSRPVSPSLHRRYVAHP